MGEAQQPTPRRYIGVLEQFSERVNDIQRPRFPRWLHVLVDTALYAFAAGGAFVLVDKLSRLGERPSPVAAALACAVLTAAADGGVDYFIELLPLLLVVAYCASLAFFAAVRLPLGLLDRLVDLAEDLANPLWGPLAPDRSPDEQPRADVRDDQAQS